MDDLAEGPISHGTLAFLQGHGRVFVLTRRADGSPTIHPMSGEWRDGSLWVNTYRKSQKVVNANRDPQISYFVTSDDTDEPFGAVNVRGTASVVESIPGQPGDQRTGFDRPLLPGDVAKRIRLKLTPADADIIR